MRLHDREVGNGHPLFLISGPCVIESLDLCLKVADELANIRDETGMLVIFKASFDKANRTSGESFRGPGLIEGLKILDCVRRETGLPILTDVHEIAQIAPAAEVCDVLQTPAFLARQTDFIRAVASCGKPVNVKKAQFMQPADMAQVVKKCPADAPLMLCERGTTFGYGNLVVDMRGLGIMAETGRPIVFDATHSVQMPGAMGHKSGGDRRHVPALARAAVAAGVAGLFMETHPDPDLALSDGPNMIPLFALYPLVRQLRAIDDVAKGWLL